MTKRIHAHFETCFLASWFIEANRLITNSYRADYSRLTPNLLPSSSHFQLQCDTSQNPAFEIDLISHRRSFHACSTALPLNPVPFYSSRSPIRSRSLEIAIRLLWSEWASLRILAADGHQLSLNRRCVQKMHYASLRSAPPLKIGMTDFRFWWRDEG